MNDITISKRFNGFEVKVGCKTLVFETKTKMMKEIGRYIADPDGVEAEYIKKYGGENEGMLRGVHTIHASDLVSSSQTLIVER